MRIRTSYVMKLLVAWLMRNWWRHSSRSWWQHSRSSWCLIMQTCLWLQAYRAQAVTSQQAANDAGPTSHDKDSVSASCVKKRQQREVENTDQPDCRYIRKDDDLHSHFTIEAQWRMSAAATQKYTDFCSITRSNNSSACTNAAAHQQLKIWGTRPGVLPHQ